MYKRESLLQLINTKTIEINRNNMAESVKAMQITDEQLYKKIDEKVSELFYKHENIQQF